MRMAIRHFIRLANALSAYRVRTSLMAVRNGVGSPTYSAGHDLSRAMTPKFRIVRYGICVMMPLPFRPNSSGDDVGAEDGQV
jgi:hypothetical protein